MASSAIDTMSLPSEALGMGNPIAQYTVKKGIPWLGAVFVGAFGLLMLVVTGNAVMSDESSVFTILIVGGLAVGALVVAVQMVISAIRNRDLRVVVLDKGLVRVGGGKTEIIRWDEVATVLQAITVHYTNGIKTGTTHIYTVTQSNGTKTVFNDLLQNVEALGNTIQQETTSRLMPKYTENYNSGGTLTFGKLTMNKSGISNGKETIPWDQVQEVKINQGQISVRKQGKWLNWAGQAAAATPNLFIFLNLVDQIVGINQKRT